MIKCHGNVREGGDDRFYVTVRGEEGHLNPFYIDDPDCNPIAYVTGAPERAHEHRAFVENWIEQNCSYPAALFGNTAVVFENEGDAVLFWFTFRP